MMHWGPRIARAMSIMWGIALLSCAAQAQGIAHFAAAERFSPTAMRKLVFDQSVRPEWIGRSGAFWYRYADSRGVRYQLVEPSRQRKSPLIDPATVAPLLARATRTKVDARTLALDDVRVADDLATLDFTFAESRFRCRVGACVPKALGPAGVPEVRLQASRSPDGRHLVIVRDHDLYVVDAAGAERRLTTDGSALHSFAIDPASTYDARRGSPVRWFGPGSSRFYVQRWDWRGVGAEPAVNALAAPRPVAESWPTSLPGESALQKHELWLFDAATGTGVQVPTDKWPGQMIGHTDLGGGFGRAQSTGVWPSRDGRRLYFVRLARGYTKRELCVFDLDTRTVTTLIAEQDPIHIDIRFAEFAEVGTGGGFAWLTQRDGWKHLDLYGPDGRRAGSITRGDFAVERILGIDPAHRQILFTASGRERGENPHYLHSYRIGFDGRGLTLLDAGEGNHRNDADSVSPDLGWLVDNYSRPDLPARSVLRDRSGKVALQLETTDTSRLDAAGWKAPERFSVKAADGVTDLYGVMFKPFDFDPTKRYPVIAYVYPGPGAQATFAIDFDPANLNNLATPQALAQLGFIVVQPSTRGGSTYRRRDYALFGHGNPRDFPMADLRATMTALAAAHPFIDLGHAGITGYSGGGLMAATAILTYPDLFKVAVAGAGDHDPNIYEQNSTEYHFGFPRADGRLRYDSNADLAPRLKGKLLLMHGDRDRDVALAHTLRLADALIRADKAFDMVVLPGADHPGAQSSPYYFRRMARYFAEHLLGDRRGTADLDVPAADR